MFSITKPRGVGACLSAFWLVPVLVAGCASSRFQASRANAGASDEEVILASPEVTSAIRASAMAVRPKPSETNLAEDVKDGEGREAPAAPAVEPQPVESVPAPPPEIPARTNLAAYHVQAGDSLKIEVYQEPDISRVYKVAENGTLNHPLLGKVPVAGLTLEAVESHVRDLLAKDYLVNPKVIVTLEHWAERPVIVFGEVKTPGAYEVPPGEKLTLLQLVARAGGFTDIAASDRLRIVRPRAEGEETIRVRVSELLKGGEHKDVDLQPGDVIIVPKTIF
jgi:protein involved in polysaccharide export with SLBB domain